MSESFFCNKCGMQNSAGAQFCSRCGASTSGTGAFAGAEAMPANVAYTGPTAAYAAPMAGVQFGGFWIRVIAVIIDSVIIRVAVSPLKLIFGGLGMAGVHTGLPVIPLAIFGGGMLLIATVFAGWLYEALMESSSYQATLGKMIFGMKVTDLNGNRISFAQATGRHFAKILSGLLLCIGFIMVGFTERKQGLHDILAGTLVQKS